jgi:hypothetical protein
MIANYSILKASQPELELKRQLSQGGERGLAPALCVRGLRLKKHY